jgi:aminopeptidase YwaD
MISLEMLGYRDPRPGSQRYPTGLRYFYPGTGDFIGLIGNVRALPHLWRLTGEVRKAVPCEFLPVPLVETLDLDFLTAVCRGLTSGLAAL